MTSSTTRGVVLGGGVDLDPDLPTPEDAYGHAFAGLHLLRHVRRFVESLGLHLVITGDRDDSELVYCLGSEYDTDVCAAELGGYRFAPRPQAIRDTLRRDLRSVLLFSMTGSSCVGWSEITWTGVRLDRFLVPGQLFALYTDMSIMNAHVRCRRFLHVAAWQEPFPTHSLATWGRSGELLDRPQPIDEHDREAAARAFRTGQVPARERSWR